MAEVPGTGEFVSFNGYDLILPVFVIVNPDDLRSKGLYNSLIVLTDEALGSFLPVFTDNDLADRMIEANNEPTWVPMLIRNTHELEQLVSTCGWYGVKYVAIDPTDPRNSPAYRNVAARSDDLITALMRENRTA